MFDIFAEADSYYASLQNRSREQMIAEVVLVWCVVGLIVNSIATKLMEGQVTAFDQMMCLIFSWAWPITTFGLLSSGKYADKKLY